MLSISLSLTRCIQRMYNQFVLTCTASVQFCSRYTVYNECTTRLSHLHTHALLLMLFKYKLTSQIYTQEQVQLPRYNTAHSSRLTVKPFILAALKVGDLACKILFWRIKTIQFEIL